MLDQFKHDLAGVKSRAWEGDVAEASITAKLNWTLAQSWEGFGKEFMPPLDEGSYLYMPTTMPHASIGEAMDILSLQDKRINAIPRWNWPWERSGVCMARLTRRPISMIETVINYRSEYIADESGRRLRFRFEKDGVDWVRDSKGKLLKANDGQPYRVEESSSGTTKAI